MVDVTAKHATHREARARAWIRLPPAARVALEDNVSPLYTAVLGGIMRAKHTSLLIPLCHPLPLDSVDVTVTQSTEDASLVVVECHVKARYHTGVEMEALTGASVASLVVYDMLKAASHGIRIEGIELVEKRGGKKDYKME
jgi:cyclic pyranopterin phosphate synthase